LTLLFAYKIYQRNFYTAIVVKLLFIIHPDFNNLTISTKISLYQQSCIWKLRRLDEWNLLCVCVYGFEFLCSNISLRLSLIAIVN
jgi:hypothetical protein